MRIGIYNQNFSVLGGGERRSLALAAHLVRRNKVTIIAETLLSRRTIENTFGIDPTGLHWIAEPNWGQNGPPPDEFDLFINNSHGSYLPNPARFGIYMCMFPQAERPDLSSYQVITANSAFTAGWIARKWGRESTVVYSACQDMGPPEPKRKIILNVGRFFAPFGNGNHKHQRVLLQCFLDMRRDGLKDWELHLIGNCGGARRDWMFVAELRREAEGHPVRIETGVDLAVLRQRYRQAALYWHATGFNSDEDKKPFAHEHFGMSVIEAMSAGAVPLAIRGGGPREVIRDGHDGFLWSTAQELQEKSWRLSRPGLDTTLRTQMASDAVIRSRQFTLQMYLARMDDIIAELTQGSETL